MLSGRRSHKDAGKPRLRGGCNKKGAVPGPTRLRDALFPWKYSNCINTMDGGSVGVVHSRTQTVHNPGSVRKSKIIMNEKKIRIM